MTRQHHGVTLRHLFQPEFCADRLAIAGMSRTEAVAKGERFAASAESLIRRGHAAETPTTAVFVPGRIEVFGKHTDYCGGRSLLCTVERGLCFAAVGLDGPKLRFTALDFNQSVEFPLDARLEPTVSHWANYPMTVARRVARNFSGRLNGADIAVTSDLPPALGLSSSSALIIGTFLVLSALNNLDRHPAYLSAIGSLEDLSAYLGCVENGQSFATLNGDRGVGTFGGSQDHAAILCCKPGKLSLYSFCPVRHQRDVDVPEHLGFFVADSGVVAEKTGPALAKYNLVSERARMIVSGWNKSHDTHLSCLKDVISCSPSALAELGESIKGQPDSHTLRARLEQFVLESDHLVPEATDAFERNDWRRLGQLTDQSQKLAETCLDNQVPETIDLCQRLKQFGAISASAFGAGFGGSVWGLYAADSAQKVTQSDTGIRGFFSRPGCAAIAIEP